MERYKNVEET